MVDKCECGSVSDNWHYPYCSKGASMEKVSESTKRDPDRWVEGYTLRNTESVRRSVVAQLNGH